MNADRISAILYRHDPANTGCNACEDMEDEYVRIALTIARIPEQPPSFKVFRDVLAGAFFEDVLSDPPLRRCYREILALTD